MPDDPVLDLEALVEGTSLAASAADFRYAGRGTRAMLVVHAGHARVYRADKSTPDGHAEANLLTSNEWTAGLAAARAAADAGTPPTVYVLVSRTPCHGVLCDPAGNVLDPDEGRQYSRAEA